MLCLNRLVPNPRYLGCCSVLVVCLLSGLAFAQCRQAQFKGHVNGGEPFSQALGSDLEFELWPFVDNGGWEIHVSQHGFSADWAYVVTPPLRGNNSQRMGNGYGETVRYELEHEHEVHFVLTKSDYEKMGKLAHEALSPYYSEDQDPTTAYFDALRKVPTGLAVVKAVDYDRLGATDQARWMDFEVTVIVPKSFAATDELKWVDASCPPPRP